jgi:hypothetical protein
VDDGVNDTRAKAIMITPVVMAIVLERYITKGVLVGSLKG